MSSATTLTRELNVPTHDFLATAPTLELSVVIVSYNVQELLRQCLRSVLEALEGLEAEILVVDNASTDGTVEALAPQFPQVRWIALERNVGFGRANNIGIAQARGRYILILNPDTLLQPDTLKTMLAYMEEHPEVGIAGCRVLNADGTFQASCRRGFPTPWAAFTKLFGLQRLFPRSRLFARYNPHFADECEVAYAEVISGAFMLCRREALRQLQGFAPEYFFYGEDVDLCYRAHRLGWRIGYVGTTAIVHFKGESTKRSSLDRIGHFYEAMRVFARRYYAGSPVLPLLEFGIAVRKLLARAAQYRQLWGLALWDSIGVVAALLVGTKLRFGSFFAFPDYAYPTVFIAVVGVVLLSQLLVGDYLEQRVQISQGLLGFVMAFFVLSALTYFFKQYAFSRGVLLGTVFGGMLWGVLGRLAVLLYGWLHRERERRIAVVGAGEAVQRLVQALWAEPQIRLLGVILPDDAPAEEHRREAPVAVLGTLRELERVVAEYRIRELIVADPALPPGEFVHLVQRLAPWRVRLYSASDLDELRLQYLVQELIGQQPLWVRYPLAHPRVRFLKRLVDLSAALLAFTIGIPALFLSARPRELLRRWWEVLTGRRSVVGLAVHAGEHYGIGKPGITGLAQIIVGENGAAPLREQLNWYYIRHFSFALDVEIVVKQLIRRWRREARAGL